MPAYRYLDIKKIMISVTSITKKYILQPPLLEKHRKSIEWLSALALWKRELAFFQKLLDQYAPALTSVENKKRVGHFQSIITYYQMELIESFSTRLRLHERKLAEMLELMDETRTDYFQEHDGLMGELEALNTQFRQNKEQFFDFIENAMKHTPGS